ncbi:hypothetical protein OPV22_009029 [Ensete ventricosum]|uniref:Uncharacterized protein n=1 Tax=Ensete ventricosum TaxID=4639 RepID=A0AAV8RDK9_ENSVE|nr:hypothetical protein OPV22_009029 [Ensete ventricosum]
MVKPLSFYRIRKSSQSCFSYGRSSSSFTAEFHCCPSSLAITTPVGCISSDTHLVPEVGRFSHTAVVLGATSRGHITASRSITTPRFSTLHTLAKAPSVIHLRVRCDLAAIPVLSFSGERVGEVPLDLKSAPSETARVVVHCGLVAEQQNQRRGIASILTTADLGYSTALQGATIRSQPLFTRLAQSKLLYYHRT